MGEWERDAVMSSNWLDLNSRGALPTRNIRHSLYGQEVRMLDTADHTGYIYTSARAFPEESEK